MKKQSLFILLTLLLTACGQSNNPNTQSIDFQHTSWSDITQKADSTTVNIHMWGGDEGINRYIDEWVAPKLKEQYNITLNRTPMDTQNILQKLHSEKRAGKQEGTIGFSGDNIVVPFLSGFISLISSINITPLLGVHQINYLRDH